MKKNFIIIVLIACLCFTTYTTFSYKMKYNQISLLYLRNKMKPAVESMEKRSQQKQQNRTVRWNYLDETDINRNPVIIYNPNVKSTVPKEVCQGLWQPELQRLFGLQDLETK